MRNRLCTAPPLADNGVGRLPASLCAQVGRALWSEGQMVGEEVIAALAQACRRAMAGTPVLAAFLYGSGAAGRMRAGSDLDVGVFTHDGGGMTLQDQLRLAAALERAAALDREVDLRCLDGSALALKAAAVRGILLYESDHTRRCELQSLILRMDMDQKPGRDYYARHYLAALAARGKPHD